MIEEEIFHRALEKPTLAEQLAFLDEVCGDRPELRERIERLLRSHKQEDSFLEVPATTNQVPGDESGSVIGPYKLIELIGEGGMGTVWMAQQTEPVKRLVAIKLIKAGMDSKQVVARFEAERQALALMDHPNIAKVFDGGAVGSEPEALARGKTDALAYASGSQRPYFVMELVKGIPITKYCDEHHLTPRQRLELFVPVCQAVQHAHQKGIIHRDLKPSNVLIALYDGRPVPKVIDFGVAKAAGQSLTDRTLVTGFGAVVGTLEYMSPEQAETNQLDIDTRSDIYSLGVLLYELLTGSTPFSKKDLEKAGMLEMLRVIREQEPSKPSTKLSTAEGLPTLAANRGTEPAKLTKLMRGELDWIVMKALEKDRGRRYETANGFAMDVQRYLADEAVQACPPSARYRFRKFARRNKVGLAVAALVLFFLVLLGSGVGWAVRDRAAREAEEARLQKARQVKVASEVEPLLAEVQRLEKEQKWGEALIVARRAAAAVAGGEAEPSTAEQVQQMLRDLEIVAALEKIRLSEVYTAGAEGKATAHHAKLYAAAFRDFGVDVEALPPEESAARLRSRPAVAIALAAALDEWARTGRKHDPDQSKRLWSLAAAVDPDAWRVSVRRASAAMDVESLVKLADAPDTARQPPQSQFLLAMTLELCDRHEQALALLERASEVYPGDFWIHYQLAWLNGKVRPARLDAAMHHIVAARALRPHSAGTWSYLGVVMMRQQKLDQAVAAARRATELDPKSAGAYSTLGLVLREQKKLGEAIAACRRAIELDPKLSVAHVNLGYALHGQKKWVEAVDAYRQAIELNPKYAMAYNNLGVALRNLKKIDEAIGCYRKAIEFDPNYPGAYRNLGSTLYDQGKSDEAIAAYRSAVRIQPNYEYSDDWIFALVLEAKPDEAVETLSELVRARPAYAYAHWELGKALQRQKKLDEAIDAYRKAVALDPKPATYRLLGAALHKQKKLDEAVNVYGKAIALGPNHVALYTDLGDVLVDQQKFDEAVDTYRKAIELYPKYALAYYSLGNALFHQKKPDEAIAAYRKAIELDPKYTYAHYNLGFALSEQKKLDEALDAFRKAIELDPQYAKAHRGLGNALVNQKKWTEAVAAYQKAIELEPKNADAHLRLGIAMYNQKKLDEAVDAFRKSIEINPKSTDAHSWLAAALLRQGKLDDAIVACRKSLEFDPKNDYARRNLVDALGQKGWGLISSPDPKVRDPKQAIEIIKAAVEVAPKSEMAWQFMGWVQYRIGDWRASIEALEKSCKLQEGGTGDAGQWIVLALAHSRLVAQDGLLEKERDHHKAEARRRYEEANKQIDLWWSARPGDVIGQAIWDFRVEAKELIAAKDGKK